MHDETALAEAEVEYENHTSSTVWVKYALLDDPAKLDAALSGKNSHHYLDNDSVDAARIDGRCISSRRRICGSGIRQ